MTSLRPEKPNQFEAASGETPLSAPPRIKNGPGSRQVRRSGMRWGWLVALILLLSGGGAGWYFWQGSQAPTVDRYLTANVERGRIEDSTTALGTLQPLEYVDVGTQVSGQLRKILVVVGQSVKKGDLLAELDPTVYQSKVEGGRAQLLGLRAQLADKQSQLQLAQQQFQRQSNLMKANATSQDAFQSAEAALRSANAQIDVLRAQIQTTESTLRGDEANLGYTKIYAPMDGTIVSLTARQGQTLNANQQAPIVLRIADLSTMTVWTQVSEADIGKLRLGMDAYFTTLGRADRRYYGKLRQVLPTPEILNNVVLYNALFDVPNAAGELMTQMSAQVFFVSAAADDALFIPAAALKPAGRSPRADVAGPRDAAQSGDRPRGERARATPSNRRIVQVVNSEGGTEDREITIGITNRVSAQVLSGLSEGEKVVIGIRAQGQQNRPGAPGMPPAARTPRLS
jgi:macrolide-specific efflux system membrane fusion protein